MRFPSGDPPNPSQLPRRVLHGSQVGSGAEQLSAEAEGVIPAQLVNINSWEISHSKVTIVIINSKKKKNNVQNKINGF